MRSQGLGGDAIIEMSGDEKQSDFVGFVGSIVECFGVCGVYLGSVFGSVFGSVGVGGDEWRDGAGPVCRARRGFTKRFLEGQSRKYKTLMERLNDEKKTRRD